MVYLFEAKWADRDGENAGILFQLSFWYAIFNDFFPSLWQTHHDYFKEQEMTLITLLLWILASVAGWILGYLPNYFIYPEFTPLVVPLGITLTTIFHYGLLRKDYPNHYRWGWHLLIGTSSWIAGTLIFAFLPWQAIGVGLYMELFIFLLLIIGGLLQAITFKNWLQLPWLWIIVPLFAFGGGLLLMQPFIQLFLQNMGFVEDHWGLYSTTVQAVLGFGYGVISGLALFLLWRGNGGKTPETLELIKVTTA